jgi:DNA-binding CsgD family transcriptional regulator
MAVASRSTTKACIFSLLRSQDGLFAWRIDTAMEGTQSRTLALAAGAYNREAGITLADKGWLTYEQEQRERAAGSSPENQFRRLPATASDEATPWRAAEWALAEIGSANRTDLYSSPNDRARFERAATIVRDSLLEAAQAAADAARRARTVAETHDEMLATLADPQRAQMVAVPALAMSSAQSGGQLSHREREVLARVAAGRTNKAIAEELYVSPNTVKSHVASLLRKLNVHTRAQLATIAVQQGLG